MLEQGNKILDKLKAFFGFGQVKSFTFKQPSVYLKFLTKDEEQEDEAEITLEEKKVKSFTFNQPSVYLEFLTKNEERVDEITQEEKDLVEDLRFFCISTGQEKIKCLNKTAAIFYQLGMLYLKEIERKSGLHQRLHILRCSVLLNGAKCRFQRMDNLSGINDADEALEMLHQKVYTLAPVKRDVDKDKLNLADFSYEVLKKIKDLREQTKKKIEKIPKIIHSLVSGDDDDDENLLDEEKRKIQVVKNINEWLYEQVLDILKEISQECSNILEPSRCKFCLIGLGSLARKDVTLYSDFEHFIALEEGVQHREDFLLIQDYFEWFAVISQLIFINFGETFIRSVAIKSLDWFYDAVTPVGFAYDGMAPQASNNPLGRTPTKKKPFRLCLIQPVSQMVNYLRIKEQLKHGYYLHDILRNTCFVYGDETLHMEYMEQADEVSKSLRNLEMLKQQKLVMDNVLPDARLRSDSKSVPPGFRLLFTGLYSKTVDVKSEVYRAITVSLNALARMKDVTSNSYFDIIDELERKNVVDSSFAHKVRLAFAVSSEIRNKTYGHLENQRGNIALEKLESFVGKHSLMRLFNGRHLLCTLVEVLFNLTDGPGDEVYFKSQLFLELGWFKDIHELLEPHMKTLFETNSDLTPDEALFYGPLLPKFIAATFIDATKTCEGLYERICSIEKYVPKEVIENCYIPYEFHLAKMLLLADHDRQKAFLESEELRNRMEMKVQSGEMHEDDFFEIEKIFIPFLGLLGKNDLMTKRNDRYQEYLKKSSGNDFRNKFVDMNLSVECVGLDGAAAVEKLMFSESLERGRRPKMAEKLFLMKSGETGTKSELKSLNEALEEFGEINEDFSQGEVRQLDEIIVRGMSCVSKIYARSPVLSSELFLDRVNTGEPLTLLSVLLIMIETVHISLLNFLAKFEGELVNKLCKHMKFPQPVQEGKYEVMKRCITLLFGVNSSRLLPAYEQEQTSDRSSARAAQKLFIQIYEEFEELEDDKMDELDLFDKLMRFIVECDFSLGSEPTDLHQLTFDAKFCQDYLDKRKKCGFTDEPLDLLKAMHAPNNTMECTHAYELATTGTSRYRENILDIETRIANTVHSNAHAHRLDIVAAFSYLPITEAVEMYKAEFKDTVSDKCYLDKAGALYQRMKRGSVFLLPEDDAYWECLFEHFPKVFCIPIFYLHFLDLINKSRSSRNFKDLATTIFLEGYRLRCHVPGDIQVTYEIALRAYGNDLAVSCQMLHGLVLKYLKYPKVLHGKNLRDQLMTRYIHLLFAAICYTTKIF